MNRALFFNTISALRFNVSQKRHCRSRFRRRVKQVISFNPLCQCCRAPFSTVTAVSLHFVVSSCSRFAVSLQCRCILLLLVVPVLHCHCSVAAFCSYDVFPFCSVTAVSLHFVPMICSHFALSLQCRCILLLVLGAVLLCHCGVAASCC